MGIYPFYKFSFLVWETTQETLNVSVMRPIKTFHQSLRIGFDTDTTESNYELDIVRLIKGSCF